jgi:RND family efflux transporter MFP subunit
MKKRINIFVRFSITFMLALFACVAGWEVWVHYEEEPWTRDGHIRADIVDIAPDVTGLVSEVYVRDNQRVKTGDQIFRIDEERYLLAVKQLDAIIKTRLATVDLAKKNIERYKRLEGTPGAASKQVVDSANTAYVEAQGLVEQSLADRSIAKLNLDRCIIRAPVNGYLTNFQLRPGTHLTPGEAVGALIDEDTIHAAGYFEETKLAHIKEGDPAIVHLMGEHEEIHGIVESIAKGVEDRERSTGAKMLANINPNISWVRLAQRFPVRIKFNAKPEHARTLIGRTATVIIGR